MGTRRGHASAWLAVVGVLIVVAGAVALLLRDPRAATDERGGPSASGSPSPAAASAPVEAVPAAWEPGAPRRLVVPALGIDVPVVPVRTRDDTLIPPADPQQLGWWADGARPGAARGSALVTGHTVHTGGGALDDLETLAPGERVQVRTRRDLITYEVERVRVYSKGRIARDAERLFSQEAPGRLVLITCEDWDGSAYLSNVVVVATPVGA